MSIGPAELLIFGALLLVELLSLIALVDAIRRPAWQWTQAGRSRGLWITILFALFTVWPLIGDGSIRAVLAISAILVLAFNTAAIVAMLRHYHSDKSFIYGLDIKHLDEMRRRKS